MRSFLLAIDAGSSSVRCTAYEYHQHLHQHGGGGGTSARNDKLLLSSSSSTLPPPPLVTAIKGVGHAIPLEAIVPNTGHIRINEVLIAIDITIDETLRLLRQRMLSCDKNMAHSYSHPYQVVAIGFSTFVMNFVALDIHGDPVGNVATCSYACNRDDVVKECHRLKDSLGAENLHAMYQRTGAPLHASYALPQLRAFYRNKDNEAIAKTIDKWATISAICLYRWSGRPQIQMPISYSEASWTGMLNFRTCSWDDQIVDLVENCEGVVQYTDELLMDEEYTECIDLLPPLVDFDAALPFLREGIPRYNDDRSDNTYWERWPELRSYPVNLFFGVGDGAAANIGSKCSGFSTSDSNTYGSHRIAVTVGTSAAARVCMHLPLVFSPGEVKRDFTIPPGLFCYRVHRDLTLVGGALTDGGSVIEWARSLLNLHSDESFDACLEQLSKDYELERTGTKSSSATMIPFLGGERSTGFRGGAQGCISGLTRETTSNHVMYACLESVVLRIHCILQLIREVCASQCAENGNPTHGIIVSSGKALESNTLWRQMLADCSSMDVVIDDDSSEGTSRGVAMLMAASLQQAEFDDNFSTFNNIDEALNISCVETPNVAASDHWNIAKIAQETLIEAIAPTWTEK